MALLKTIIFFSLCSLYSCSNITEQTHLRVAKSQHDLPVFSIQANFKDLFDESIGIYVEGIGIGKNWQGQKANYFSNRKINIDLAFYEEGELLLRQKAKMKVSGGGSRKQPQKSFNLSCKDGFSYPFFKHLPFYHYKSLRLRVSGQDWRETHIRDGLMHTLVAKTNIDIQAYQPVILYLN